MSNCDITHGFLFVSDLHDVSSIQRLAATVRPTQNNKPMSLATVFERLVRLLPVCLVGGSSVCKLAEELRTAAIKLFSHAENWLADPSWMSMHNTDNMSPADIVALRSACCRAQQPLLSTIVGRQQL